VKSCVDVVDCSSVEIVDEFCYPGDVLSVDGDADAAVIARIHSGWFKFRSPASFLTDKDVSFLLREKVWRAADLRVKDLEFAKPLSVYAAWPVRRQNYRYLPSPYQIILLGDSLCVRELNKCPVVFT